MSVGLTHQYPVNEHGELLEICGGIVCNLNYWDCSCDVEYIHHQDIDRCWRCGGRYEYSPASREDEVRELIRR